MGRLKTKYKPINAIKDQQLGFDISNKSILMLLGQKSDKDPNYIKELQNNLQHELLNYRYLLHPTRLMMLKLLYGEYKLPSSIMRQVLDISWGEFATHRSSLLEKGYIEMSYFSSSGSIDHMLYLTEQGKQEYETVISLLVQLAEEKTPYHYLIHAEDIEQNDPFYPKK